MTMQEEIRRRRTFAIISHPDAGKTTLTEKFLLYGGAIAQAGVVKGKKNSRAAVSDWMEIEKQRGISVTSSVLQFSYNGYCINILDTPGHQDFSEDTYRTLMAADSAVMVIDGSKGVEAQTRKLFKVCTLRHIPIFTFINKMDRDARDPFELCEQIEEELGIETCPINWPIGSGKEFQGVYDRPSSQILFFSDTSFKSRSGSEQVDLEDPHVGELIGEKKWQQLQEEVELLGAQENPDPYIAHSDMLVQCSLFEGKSIVLDEAKILGIPIIATEYPTVRDQVTENKEGLIVPITPEGLADGIEKMIRDAALRESIAKYLLEKDYGNTAELKKYLELIDG